MRIWCILNRNPADRWCESCALWSSFPVADVSNVFLGKLLCYFSLTTAIKNGYIADS
jgi:hypothetical protein